MRGIAMPRYRHALPQTGDTLFATDGGLETTLIYHEGVELPAFASFDLLKNDSGTALLRRYFERYTQMAKQHKLGIVLESATWRANPQWAERLGYDAVSLAEANRKAIDLLCEIRDAHETPQSEMVISGNLGPRGDGYVADSRMTPRSEEHTSE